MTDRPSDQNPYERWLEMRRGMRPPAELSNQVMTQIMDLERGRRTAGLLRLMELMERSRAVRWGVCGSALAVGAVPYLFLVHVPSF